MITSFFVKVSDVEPNMKGRKQYLGLKGWMLLWIILELCIIIPYSVTACDVPNCTPSSQCIGNTCYECNDGYYLLSGLCIQCQQSLPNCTTCDSSLSCTECIDGYYLQSGSCLPCPDRCATCTSDTQCTKCRDTYWNRNDNVCSSDCSSNCLDSLCDGTTGFCYSCLAIRYGLVYGCNLYCSTRCLDRQCDEITGLCNACITGKYGQRCEQDCNLCRDGECALRKCSNGCKDGYLQEYRDNGQSYCRTCYSYLTNCMKCSNASVCTECKQGYYITYGHSSSGEGYGYCYLCSSTCLLCSNTEQCHEDCIQHCSNSVNPGTSMSTYETSIISSSNDPQTSTSSGVTPTSNDKHTRLQETSNYVTSTESTIIEDCQHLNDELNRCQQQEKTCNESDDQYQLTFSHGLVTGIGGSIVLFGLGVGVAFCLLRKTKLQRRTSENSEGNHEYVNTNMTDIISVRSPSNDEVTNDIHTIACMSTNSRAIDTESSRDYDSIRYRPTDEYNYSDFQNM